jgi:transcription elongation factor Elf1
VGELTRQSHPEPIDEPATCDACGAVLLVKKSYEEGRAWWTCSGCGSEFEIGLGPLRVLYPDLAAVRDA